MTEWRSVKIEDLAAPGKNSLATGPFGSAIGSRFFREDGVPVIRGSNLSLKVGDRLLDDEIVFVDESKAEEFPRSVARQGDLVFTCWGTIGQIGLVDDRARFDRYIVSNKQMKLTPDPSLADSLFLYYALSSPEAVAHVQGMAIGSSVPGFNLTQLRQVVISCPPLHEQKVIAAALGALDDKIAANERLIATLDGMTHALFKQNFSGIGLPGDRDGWKLGRLSDLCSTQYGYTASADAAPVGPRFLRVKDINKKNWIEWSSVPYCRISDADLPKYRVSVGDIVVARMADPGKSALIEEPTDAVFASYLVRLKTASLAHAYFVWGFLKSDIYGNYAKSARSGSVQANMNAKVITAAELAIPPLELMESHLMQVAPVRQRMLAALRENASLAILRDTLLPQLMSGKLRVREAEKIVEDAV
ncbi:restriction endonuclease subunit S [Streptomyces swartbergensis]|uniref:restriction endonuclease subunit S n=1 Tax=Streptomyces swartbergensis TaxID=487165 RepID=UPI00382E5141